QQVPAPRSVPRPRTASLSFSAPPFGIEESAQVFESIGSNEPGGDQFPQRVFDFTGKAACRSREVCKERCATRFERRQYFARRVGQRLFGRRLRSREKPTGIFTQENRERRDTRGPHPAGLRRLLLPFESGMRREASPAHFACETELIEEIGFVVRDAPRQDYGLPRRGGELASLQLPDHLQRPIDAVELRARSEVLPAVEEGIELGGGHGLDLAAQPPDGQSMDTRQQAAVAPFDLSCAKRELAAQDLPLGLELC